MPCVAIQSLLFWRNWSSCMSPSLQFVPLLCDLLLYMDTHSHVGRELLDCFPFLDVINFAALDIFIHIQLSCCIVSLEVE